MSTNTLQKNLAEIRDLRCEEIDLAGAGYTTEATYVPSYTMATIQTPEGPRTVQYIGDITPDTITDYV